MPPPSRLTYCIKPAGIRHGSLTPDVWAVLVIVALLTRFLEPPELSIAPDNRATLRFALGSGSYATEVLTQLGCQCRHGAGAEAGCRTLLLFSLPEGVNPVLAVGSRHGIDGRLVDHQIEGQFVVDVLYLQLLPLDVHHPVTDQQPVEWPLLQPNWFGTTEMITDYRADHQTTEESLHGQTDRSVVTDPGLGADIGTATIDAHQHRLVLPLDRPQIKRPLPLSRSGTAWTLSTGSSGSVRTVTTGPS